MVASRGGRPSVHPTKELELFDTSRSGAGPARSAPATKIFTSKARTPGLFVKVEGTLQALDRNRCARLTPPNGPTSTRSPWSVPRANPPRPGGASSPMFFQLAVRLNEKSRFFFGHFFQKSRPVCEFRMAATKKIACGRFQPPLKCFFFLQIDRRFGVFSMLPVRAQRQ